MFSHCKLESPFKARAGTVLSLVTGLEPYIFPLGIFLRYYPGVMRAETIMTELERSAITDSEYLSSIQKRPLTPEWGSHSYWPSTTEKESTAPNSASAIQTESIPRFSFDSFNPHPDGEIRFMRVVPGENLERLSDMRGSIATDASSGGVGK